MDLKDLENKLDQKLASLTQEEVKAWIEKERNCASQYAKMREGIFRNTKNWETKKSYFNKY